MTGARMTPTGQVHNRLTKKLDAYREEGYLTVGDLAKKLGLSRSYIPTVMGEPDLVVRSGGQAAKLWKRERLDGPAVS